MEAPKGIDYSKNPKGIIAIVLLVIVIIIYSILAWHHLRKSEYNNLQNYVSNASLLITRPIQQAISGYISSFQRMQWRWHMHQGIVSKKLWQQDAQNFYIDTKVFDALMLLNDRNTIQWMVPERETVTAGEKFNGQGEQINAASNLSKKVFMQPIIFKHNNDIAIVAPLNTAETSGSMIGILNMKKFLLSLFPRGLGQDYGVAVYQSTISKNSQAARHPIYATQNTIPDPFLVKQTNLTISNVSWEFYIWPTSALIKKVLSPLPTIILLGGMILATLLGSLFYLYLRYRHSVIMLSESLQEQKVSNQRFENIINTMNEAFIGINEESEIIAWNPHAEKIFGWSRNEIRNQKLHETIIPKEYREAHRKGLQHFLKTGEAKVFGNILQMSGLHKNGSIFPLDLNIFPLKMDDHYVFYAFIRDISERVRYEQDLMRFKSIVNASDDAIISTNKDGIVETFNKGATTLYGYQEKEILGQHVSILYPEDLKNQAKDNLKNVLSRGHISHEDSYRQGKNGDQIPVSISLTPILDKSNEVVGVASSSRDITERKKIEKMKNEFISVVSHELRTPLTSIRGSLGLLISEKVGPLPAQVMQLLNIANNNCERLIRLINDILDIEKIEAGKMEFNYTICDPQLLINEVVAANEGFAEKFQVKITIKVISKAEVKIDKDKIEQALTNLLSNAIRYSPQGGVIEVTIEKLNKMLRIAVHDQGPGIPASFQDKIFGKFNQADTTSTRKKSGTGLGLNISKAIIEQHGGTINFETTIGKGTTFYFDLPVIKSYADAYSSYKDIKILIYEQDAKKAKFIKSVFKQKNIENDTASGYEEAMELLEKNRYSAITLDFFASKDNPEFIRMIKSQPQTKFIPIIITVLEEDKNGELNGKIFPLIDWMNKPLDKDKTDKIYEYLTKQFQVVPAKILCVEDDADIPHLIQLMLQDTAQVVVAGTIAEAKELASENSFDLMILDLNLPDGYGTSLLPCIDPRTNLPIPVIVFSIDTLDNKYLRLVKNSLIKSRTTNEELIAAIESVINTRNK